MMKAAAMTTVLKQTNNSYENLLSESNEDLSVSAETDEEEANNSDEKDNNIANDSDVTMDLQLSDDSTDITGEQKTNNLDKTEVQEILQPSAIGESADTEILNQKNKPENRQDSTDVTGKTNNSDKTEVQENLQPSAIGKNADTEMQVEALNQKNKPENRQKTKTAASKVKKPGICFIFIHFCKGVWNFV